MTYTPVWEKIKLGKAEDAWVTSLIHLPIRVYIHDIIVMQEEYEDSLGNGVNRKTYEDFRRQGLL